MEQIKLSAEEQYNQAENFICCLTFLANEAKNLNWSDAHIVLKCAILELQDIRDGIENISSIAKTKIEHADLFKSFRLFLKICLTHNPQQTTKIINMLEDVNQEELRNYVY